MSLCKIYLQFGFSVRGGGGRMGSLLDNHVAAYQGNNIYDFDNEIQLNWYPKRIIGLSHGAGSLLELGLGHGITATTFSPHFKRHVVIDASPAVIANFKQRYPGVNIEIVESYFEQFDTTEKFDVIVFGYILEHVDDPVLVLKHFRQFLQPNGLVFVTVPNAEVMNRKLGHLAGMLLDMQQLSDHDLLLGHKRYYTAHSLKSDVEKAGYVVKRTEGIYLKPLTTSQMLSLDLDLRIIDALCLLGVDYPELSCGILLELTVATE